MIGELVGCLVSWLGKRKMSVDDSLRGLERLVQLFNQYTKQPTNSLAHQLTHSLRYRRTASFFATLCP